MILSTPFNQSDLNANKQFVLTHNLNTNVIAPVYIDNTGINQTTVGIFAFGDENGNDTLNKCTLSLNGDITGIHILELVYTSSIEQLNGKKLFEQSTLPSSNPNENDRLALGRAGVSAYNMTLSSLKNWLSNALGSVFLKKADNLSGLNNTAAQNNLQVPSLAYVNSQLSQKAGIFQPASGAALGTANSLEYTPATNYNPATKKYADDNNKVLCVGTLTNATNSNPTVTIYSTAVGFTPVFTCTRHSAGYYEINHNLGAGYASLSQTLWDGNPTIPVFRHTTYSKDEYNRFFIFVNSASTGNTVDAEIKFILIRF